MSARDPLHIIIIGAGLGGLAAAVCFARDGHNVQVLEQRPSLSHKGSGLMIRPGASRYLISWGIGPEFQATSDTSPASLIRHLKTGKVMLRNIAVDISDYPDWGNDRQTIQQILYDSAIKAGTNITFDAVVQDLEDSPSSAWLTLKNGQTLKADLIIAADGIRSRTRAKILTHVQSSIDPMVSNVALCGIKLPLDQVRQNPRCKSLTETVHLNVWMGEGRYVVGRMNSRSKMWGGLFGIASDPSTQKGLWDENGDINLIRRQYAHSDRCLTAALDMAQSCDRWQLAEMPNLPFWTSKQGHIILLGDSAHAMQPNAAQGFSQIIEDIAVLSYLLNTHYPNMSISELTTLWQTLRKPRVERIKAYAAWNTSLYSSTPRTTSTGQASSPIPRESGAEQDPGRVKSLKNVKPDMNAPFHTSAFLKWALDFDAVEEAQRFMEGLSKAKI